MIGGNRERLVFQGQSAAELEQWLVSGGIDTSLYGRGAAKSVEELFEEVELGESVLHAVEGDCCRVVSVLNVFIQNSNGQVLMEEKQVRPNGEERYRGLPLSEKLKGGEAWRPAVQRAICEELGSILPESPKIEVLLDTYTEAVEVNTSASYPGLESEYRCHRVQARVEGLPRTKRFISTEPRPDGILQNHWIWQPMHSN